MEPEALTTIAVMFVLMALFSYRHMAVTATGERDEIEEIEDSDIDEELTDEILAQLRAYAGVAREVSVKRANGDVYEVKFRHDEPTKVVHNVAAVTPEQTKMVWSEDGRMLQRETLNWGGEQ
jgi:Na+/H+ antiporter NhaB